MNRPGIIRRRGFFPFPLGSIDFPMSYCTYCTHGDSLSELLRSVSAARPSHHCGCFPWPIARSITPLLIHPVRLHESWNPGILESWMWWTSAIQSLVARPSVLHPPPHVERFIGEWRGGTGVGMARDEETAPPRPVEQFHSVRTSPFLGRWRGDLPIERWGMGAGMNGGLGRQNRPTPFSPHTASGLLGGTTGRKSQQHCALGPGRSRRLPWRWTKVGSQWRRTKDLPVIELVFIHTYRKITIQDSAGPTCNLSYLLYRRIASFSRYSTKWEHRARTEYTDGAMLICASVRRTCLIKYLPSQIAASDMLFMTSDLGRSDGISFALTLFCSGHAGLRSWPGAKIKKSASEPFRARDGQHTRCRTPRHWIFPWPPPPTQP
jgi:hypothetical protein